MEELEVKFNIETQSLDEFENEIWYRKGNEMIEKEMTGNDRIQEYIKYGVKSYEKYYGWVELLHDYFPWKKGHKLKIIEYDPCRCMFVENGECVGKPIFECEIHKSCMSFESARCYKKVENTEGIRNKRMRMIRVEI